MKPNKETDEQEKELGRLWREQRDYTARDTLIEMNFWYARWCAKVFQVGRRLTKEERRQIAYASLVEAAERFDERRGKTFRAYAGWYILGALGTADTTADTPVRYPAGLYASARRIEAAKRELEAALKRKPTRAEIMQCAGVQDHAIDSGSEPILPRSGQSFDASLSNEDGDDRTLYDLTANDTPTPETLLMAGQELADITRRLEAFLADAHRAASSNRAANRARDFACLVYRYGIHRPEGMELETVGDLHSISHQRVHQIINRLWHKLRDINHDYTEAWLEALLEQRRTIETLLENEQ